MADGKNKIIFYSDWKDSFNELTDEEAGKLIKHFFSYINDEDPILKDRVLRATWIPIEKTLKRDLNKWEQYSEKQRLNGLKGGRPPKTKETQKTHGFTEKPKKGVKDKVKDKDSINNDGFLNSIVKNPNEHATYIESQYRKHKLKKGSLHKLLKDFNLSLLGQQRQHETMKDYKQNFSNWLNTMNGKGLLKDYKL